MKWHIIGHLAIRTRHVGPTDILAANGFNLSKKIFVEEVPAGSKYFQADTKEEDRALRLQFPDSFHLQKEKAEHGGGYR